MIQRFKFPKGKRVRIHAQGTTYEGVIKGASENEVYLQGSHRMWVLPILSITKCSVQEVLQTEEAVDLSKLSKQ